MSVDGAVDGTGRGAIREVRGPGRSCGWKERGARREVHACGRGCGWKRGRIGDAFGKERRQLAAANPCKVTTTDISYYIISWLLSAVPDGRRQLWEAGMLTRDGLGYIELSEFRFLCIPTTPMVKIPRLNSETVL